METINVATSPQGQSALLRSVLGITPQKSFSCTASTPVSVKKTDMLKQVISGKIEAKSEVKDHKQVSPLRSHSNKKKVKNSGKPSVASNVSSHYAGSAFISAPHPDSVPMPDFDENFFN
jgi:hypothetical protein